MIKSTILVSGFVTQGQLDAVVEVIKTHGLTCVVNEHISTPGKCYLCEEKAYHGKGRSAKCVAHYGDWKAKQYCKEENIVEVKE